MNSELLAAAVAVPAVAATAGWLRQYAVGSRLRGTMAGLEADRQAREAELRAFVQSEVPALLLGHLDGTHPRSVRAELAGTAFGELLQEAAAGIARTVGGIREQAENAAATAVRSTMRGVLAHAYEQQKLIGHMQEAFDDPDVFEGLMRIDHTNAQISARAVALAVLAGAPWPGRQHPDTPLIDVARAAKGRIRDFHRVVEQGDFATLIRGRAVEPLALALAELLDNAARHSEGSSPIEVAMERVPAGVFITIDDRGVGMEQRVRARAAEILEGRSTLPFSQIGEPASLGLFIVAAAAGRYGFRVSVDKQSPYGGVRAVVLLPSGLLATADPEPQPVPAAPTPLVNGLPQRRRQRRSQPELPTARPEQLVASTDAEASRSRLSAFTRGVRDARATASPEGQHP
ncbi:hypothetical protein GCM10010495_48510 [Kitasatospora herbaricolor]|uniref:ATP-binding protein n=1 Tax=Kitasatospora herbaricolor TaxID=68217 RepID=UPI001748FBA4|nr:ATP-binding protein [Kitasatospora herbaricolor]MDQ0305782.1 signal transduction histidine kinase [Kitasatospora herbaricolor]GGV26848.1 hypothetical protein GCM10010495_48510 [Kitasatospora herbaricolor]